MNLSHQRQQWPVGHGFFHTGMVKTEADSKVYRYVYDCGSKSRSQVVRQIESYCKNEELEHREPVLDMLVLSHFHADHINGVPQLLKLFKVKKLVLPYLARDFQLAALANLLASGYSVWEEFSDLVLNPKAWLDKYGQEDVEITQVRADGEGLEANEASVEDMNIFLPKGEINHGTKGLLSANGQAFWDFKFYVHENQNRWSDLRQKFVHKFFHDSDELCLNLLKDEDFVSVRLFDWLKDPAWVKLNFNKVKEVFCSLKSYNQNGTTLCMYSGPARGRKYCGVCWSTQAEASCRRCNGCEFDWGSCVGWLGTGDAELQSAHQVGAFSRHYCDYIHSIDTLTIPHHGSIENYCAELGDIGQAAVLTSNHACDPRNQHPNNTVVKNLRTKKRSVFIVTKDESSAVFTNARLLFQ